ncbi:hypothetical protein HD597_005251 [Nonomuraea thailandensis]|uniref:MerR family transcriptional regulator n=1 Tax=Nonomuraea thailandensis TaxID=1188745 RepID=A0A9X2GME6_9ACTN|nr:hypothetical protein [Nonomuraea thailandensis]
MQAGDGASPRVPPATPGVHRDSEQVTLRLAAPARELVDAGNPVEAACRIIILEDQLADALRINEELRRRHD